MNKVKLSELKVIQYFGRCRFHNTTHVSTLPDTTTDESTTEVIPTTVPVQSTTSCAGDGTLNRTNAGLNRECGAYSGTGKCIISHSACTEISKTWQCKCVQGYAEKSGQCVKMPNGLFKDIDRTRTVSVSENAGESVLNVIFSEINGFESITNQEAKIVGSDAEHFEIIYPIQSRFLIKTKTKLTMLKYEITVIVSVQIDNVIVRDHVHIIVNVIRSTSDITRKTLVVLDGTLSGSTIGFICTSCIKQAVLYPKQDIFSVENDGSVNTTKNIDLDSLIGETTITYSKQYNITNKNDPSVVLAIIDLVITRRMFTKQLPDVSKIDTKVGQFDLHDKLKIENLGDTGFTINSDNYLLLGTNRLEYAESQKVEKTLQISIGDVSFNIEVEIEVLDANNNPPSFPENNEYNFKMIQSVYPDLIVGFVKAEDKDTKSRIFYTISPNDKLEINNDGVISIKSAFSTNENYTVKITASDGLYSEDVDVIFEIIPGVEQNLNKSFTGMVNENRSPGTFVTTASASGYKAYSFADYTARTNFKIDSNTGLITTVKELDREQQDRYRYTIVAHKNDTQSCTLVVIGEVTIRIGDVNDEPPVFAHPFYNATVPENETSTSLTMHVLISTTDKDINPSVLYSVVSPSDKFSINSITGEIKTIRVLDRETDPTYEITVRANDSVNSATATVTVQVLDKNDNEPKFSRHVPGFSVSENASIGTVVISISANDSDEGKNAEITYDLDSPGGFFKIDQTTGEIKLLRELDREKSPIHYITVYARDNGDNILSSTSTLTVTVTDINDNSPKFNLSEMTVSVEENNDCTTAILKLNATDADEDNTQNSQITYTIVSNDQDITIDNNGVLKCRQSFDFEQQRSHTVVIRASDNGKPPLFAEQNVTVNINDVNDNQPEFKKQLTNLTIRYVNGGSSISQIVEIVSATDRDSGENGMVTYNMSGTAASFLNIDPDRGIIRTNKGMVPINQQYTLTVIVKDKGDPPKQTSSNINVNFQAIQTQPVKFNQELLEFTISENNAIGNRIGSIRNNVLHPSGTNVLFEIIDTVSVTAFSINASTGIITSSLTLDREVQDNHEFVVKVKNSVNGEQSDLSVIRVEVEDENDEKPVFGRVQDYTYTISEHLDTGAHATADVEEITASDADIGNNAIIDFKIEDGGDCIKKFKLTTMAENKMAVSLNENVDYEKMKSCTFLVTAFNRYEPQMNSTVRAVVRIMDYNDNDPVFEGHTNNEYDIDIPEDTTINSEPIVIGRVTDADDRENKDVELKISDDCWFNSIKDDEQFSLKLKPSQTLDYDDGPITNKCVITANDKAKDENLRRSATATVNIRITDVNDNPPVFDKKKKYVNVPRDEEIDFIITTVVATDRDSGSNGNITYSLRNSAHSASFTINPSTGALKINAPLIAIEKDKITLTIIATDKGSPLLSDTMQVEINITDENPRPFFTKSGSVEIQEHNTLPDGLIEQVVAYDRKSGIVEICDCIYYIDTKRDDIFIERNTGKIKFKSVNGTLDREKETNGRVQFAVIAQDKDNPPKNSSNIGFVIEIKDINDNTPAFKNPELSFAFPQNAPDGYVFGKVHAEDPDVNPKTFYSINLTQAGDNLKTDVVHINQETGELTKHGNTTLTFTQDAKIEGFVAAWDSEGDTNSTSYARIIIKVEFDDKNKHTPTFDRNTYTGEIRWDSKAEKSILQVNATDLDKDVQGEVHYSIVNGNTRGFFNVDKDGVVYLQYLLDSSIGTGNRVTVNLTIKAEDRGIIPKYSHANVRVVITGINPGVCIQESDHNKQVVDLETERNSWSNALYGLVAALCVSIIVCCVLLYKWRTSIPSSGGEPFYKRDKQYAENPEYDDLSRRQTVQYSQSNQAFDPPAPHLDFHPGKDEYTRIEENTGETSPFRMSDIEESPDYTPEERRRHMPPAAYSFNPNYLTS